jgi:hypothetical protein
VSVREPDELLAELGAELRRGWARPRARRAAPGPWLRRPVVIAALAALVLVPTAVATRDVLWAPEPPALPERLRVPGAARPARVGEPVYVASGHDAGVAWQLSASACEYGRVRAVGLFLEVPGGGGGARCDLAATGVADLAARRVYAYFDPEAGVTWVFGAVPASVASVEILGRRIAPREADPAAVGRGRLPGGLRVFVVALPGGGDVPVVRGLDRAGRVVATCVKGRCRP